MMSFRRAVDYTYIAQLLGRMIRTPLQQRVLVDETLNEVHLYLPQFDETTVYDVVEALKSTEGATIPADIEVEEVDSDNYETLVLKPTYTVQPRKPGQKNADPTYAVIILSTESAFSAIGGAIFGIDNIPLIGYAGCVLMFGGIIFSQLEFPRRKTIGEKLVQIEETSENDET
jgi:hypothetical protein